MQLVQAAGAAGEADIHSQLSTIVLSRDFEIKKKGIMFLLTVASQAECDELRKLAAESLEEYLGSLFKHYGAKAESRAADNAEAETILRLIAEQNINEEFKDLALYLLLRMYVNAHDVQKQRVCKFEINKRFVDTLDPRDVDKPKEKGLPPLFLFMSTNSPDAVLVGLLLDKGASISIEGPCKMRPIHWAAHFGDVKALQTLIKRGADVNAEAIGVMTPLHCAAYNGFDDCVEFLLQAGAFVNAKGIDICRPSDLEAQIDAWQQDDEDIDAFAERPKNGFSALHIASHRGKFAVVEKLIKSGADVHDRDKEGKSALSWAVFSRHLDVIAVLILAGADREEAKPLMKDLIDYLRVNDNIQVLNLIMSDFDTRADKK